MWHVGTVGMNHSDILRLGNQGNVVLRHAQEQEASQESFLFCHWNRLPKIFTLVQHRILAQCVRLSYSHCFVLVGTVLNCTDSFITFSDCDIQRETASSKQNHAWFPDRWHYSSVIWRRKFWCLQELQNITRFSWNMTYKHYTSITQSPCSPDARCRLSKPVRDPSPLANSWQTSHVSSFCVKPSNDLCSAPNNLF